MFGGKHSYHSSFEKDFIILLIEMDTHTEDGDHVDLYSMNDGIDHTFDDSLFDDQHHGIDKNPIEDCYIYDNIDQDANDLGDISIEDETLGVFDDNQSNDNHQSSNHQHVTINGKQYWIPKVPDEVKPKLKGHYRSYEDITNMYYKYALAAGFDVRKTTNRKNGHGIIRLRYFVCNRQGLPNTGHVDTLNPNRSKIKRRTDSRRTGCNACIRFSMIKGSSTWLLYEFVEEHNHELMYQDNIFLSNQNVGATQAHRLFTAINGGYNIIGGTIDDFKNLMRDLNCFIGGTDAQMLVNKMNNKTKNVPNFSFDFRVENKQLNAMFWANETSKINYKEFGDVVSFDATFRTNRYDMVFVPFTGIDNHKKCVTFGVGLLSKEDIDSYTLLLKSFLKAFDPAMKNAIANVFPKSIHWLCMWHITSKLPLTLLFNSLIWNSKLEEKDFEQGWQALLDEYDLNDNTWLNRIVPMSGLMITTSRSESQNSAFHQNTHYGSTLVNFMNSFESAMEKQHYTQSSLDFKTKDKFSKMRTPFPIEENASLFYTRKVFRQVQNEMCRPMTTCFSLNHNIVDHVHEFQIKEFRPHGYSISNRPESDIVKCDQKEDTFIRSCMKFEQFGILCRHIFTAMKAFNIQFIPAKYLLRRWQKDIIPPKLLRRCFHYSDSDENIQKVAIDIFSTVDNCLSSLSTNKKRLEEYYQALKELESKFVDGVTMHERPNKSIDFENRLGVSIPADVQIQNPTGIRNKGVGLKKGLKVLKKLQLKNHVVTTVVRVTIMTGGTVLHERKMRRTTSLNNILEISTNFIIGI
uniref:Protein FAR1-RELATED SEQUENCE n=1 Tax=Lactuca sativa TaxID=4236 RepID=A0A9R1WYX4_LACSA|nr:hypothetical protein LSAT_V11C800396140 [Lactuca sativa]